MEHQSLQTTEFLEPFVLASLLRFIRILSLKGGN